LNVATTCPASTPVVPTYTQHINLGHLSLGNGPGVTFYHGAMSSGYLIDPNDLMDNMCLASGGTNWQESLQGASKAVDSERRLLPQWTQIVVGSNTTAANYCQQIQSVITISVDRNFNASWMDINLINVHENWHVNTLETSYTTQMSLFQPTLEALTVPTGGSQVCDATSAKQQVQTQRTNAIIQTNQLFEQALLAIHDLDEANAQASEAAPRAALIQSICSYARSQHFASCSLCQ
jgi:hypothetical protein